MAEEKKGIQKEDDSVRDRESQIAAGLIGVLLVIGAFLTYNYFQKSKEKTTEPLIAESIEEKVKDTEKVETSEEPGKVTVKETEEEEKTEEKVTVKEGEEEPAKIVVTEPSEETEKKGEVIAAEEKATEGTYVVKEGDCCLWKIAEKLYGNPYDWTKIAEVNNLPKNSLGRPIVKIGDTLNLPTKVEEAVQKEEKELPTTYTVQKGDNLWKIAENFYGDGFAWTKIWDANNLNRLPDGTVLIHAGNVLTIPK